MAKTEEGLTKLVSTRIPHDTVRLLDRMAAQVHEPSINNLLKFAIREFAERYDKKWDGDEFIKLKGKYPEPKREK